tara:strand:+ start:17 stop:346 length:330 start_codon:yes stop_codon:yes gene_type:complete
MIMFWKFTSGIVAKKLKGEYFIFSANRLKDGKVVFYSEEKNWVTDSNFAKKIFLNEISKFEEFVSLDEKKCLIVSPYLIEVNEEGKIKKLREKIRSKGLNDFLKKNVQI